MKNIRFLLLFTSALVFSQHSNLEKKSKVFKSKFYANASTVFLPYQNKGFYKQNVVKSLGWSLEGGIYFIVWDELYVQLGLNESYFRAYNFRKEKGVYHQVVSHLYDFSIPIFGGFQFYKEHLTLGIGFRKTLRYKEFYHYRIYENGKKIYDQKSKYLNQHLVLQSSPFSLLLTGSIRIKNQIYLRLDYQFFYREAFSVGLTSRLPW